MKRPQKYNHQSFTFCIPFLFPFFFTFTLSFHPLNTFVMFTFIFLFVAAGFLIIPKKVEQNQTKVFDRDKLTSIANYTVPNMISDSNKNLNSFKSIKSTTNSSNSSLSDGVNKLNVTITSTTATNNSSNQLITTNETEISTYFSTTNLTNITAQVGSIVEVPCTVHHLGEGTVS